ncbi:NAD(P)-binding oxidoreductase [Diaminobutyricimonas sp. LJ205]|uniref:NAD(P)-binding oxidoreductase n=1 Tax=Diaminobutyricimonas sp. LJ205 TaxID=2683590 RepID=UPI0012F49D3D|nr:NAD(P)-binding oxidoreductase [Diaminobutyricimonas sp. LJ205]
MRIVIAGGHGKIALLLSQLLTNAGHQPVGIIRNPDQSADLEQVGSEPLVLDLEHTDVATLAAKLQGADAVVFAAGAGPGSGAARKTTVDRDAAILLADAAEAAGIRRLVQISAIATDRVDPNADEVMQAYSRAKSEADAAIRPRSLDWTIVRPGGLTNEPPTGLITVGDTVERGTIPRADVAAVVAHLLVTGAGVRRQFELVSGSTPSEQAPYGDTPPRYPTTRRVRA